MYNESVSRYLRWLALCYCPIKPNNESRMKKVWVDVITSANSVVIKHYVDLKFQCDQYFSRKESGASNRHVEFLTTGVHNIMKHIDSLKEETTALDKAQIVASGLVEKGQWTYEDSVKYFAIKFNDLKLIVDKANSDIIQMDLELKNRVICINGKKVIYPDLNTLISNEISPDDNTEGLPSNATTVDTGNYVTTEQEKKVTHSELNIPLCRDTSIDVYKRQSQFCSGMFLYLLLLLYQRFNVICSLLTLFLCFFAFLSAFIVLLFFCFFRFLFAPS